MLTFLLSISGFCFLLFAFPFILGVIIWLAEKEKSMKKLKSIFKKIWTNY